MRTNHLAAALFVSVSCALLTASCIEIPTEALETEPIGEAPQESGKAYESKDFRFVVVVKDDGEGKGGGWQAADKTFHFVERNLFIPVYRWQCRIRVEMPIRSEVWGPISASRAALLSADVANEVVDPLLGSVPTWRSLGIVFCEALRKKMETSFDEHQPKLGVRVLLNK